MFSFLLWLALPVRADLMPYYVHSVSSNSIGVYQVSNNINVYKEPNEKSPLLLSAHWDKINFDCADVPASNIFVVFLQKRDLGFVQVVDENEDESWVQVIYDKNGNLLGWIKKEDDFRFLPWRTFFNWYGRKYGLYYLKDAPDETKNLYGSNMEGAKSIGKITVPQTIKLEAVKGNWLLINAFDIDKISKIGWIKWRNTTGEIYLFPVIR